MRAKRVFWGLAEIVLEKSGRFGILLLLMLSLGLVSCRALVHEPSIEASGFRQPVALPTVTLTTQPTDTSKAGSSVAHAALATPLPAGLLILHTNDNWGETEPCG